MTSSDFRDFLESAIFRKNITTESKLWTAFFFDIVLLVKLRSIVKFCTLHYGRENASAKISKV